MSKKFIELNIGRNKPTFIIAEAGINHDGDLDLAFKMVDTAKAAGSSAIKFQTYTAEKRAKADSPIFAGLKQRELSYDQQRKIKEYADQKGLMFFSTPFDPEAAEFLQSLEVPLMKIASFDIVNKVLLEAVAKTGTPTIISRGMASREEIDTAVKIFEKYGTEYAILHCVSSYPAPKEEVNLNIINSLLQNYSCPVGYSDHTLGAEACVYAVALGARIIEKHFTTDKTRSGADHSMSADGGDIKELVEKIRQLETMLGNGEIKSLPVEEPIRIYRRET
ncbi:MAG: hypothetical protein A3C85_03970 [Candidatus Doudnabacteria bacterium RIFCSPHIGHO2_02_FULL_48_21]|nr:MAG: hypothetical protein A3K05_03990 [Candidatus Doudnabacteria bacterium RIFCSPHIGHO2_01_48_18]OGE91175.1 MAG: hypothetical protein A3F44_02500 [Candidatus Doudnabacteria bacterium RIFCSPHIGHO2_12_FULL_47_25]OGE93613.1 MAG: hypothetical protein A3C85_03970 [Candidatus Doudnabacteria bacterium RIFCSPHIGHO2_02_FULL_48_21]